MTDAFRAATAAILLTALLGACSPPAEEAAAKAEAGATLPASADVHRFTIGAIEAFALRDGGLSFPNDNKTVGVGRTPAEIAALLTAASLPGETLDLSLQPLLIRSGERVVLFDTGAGGQMGTQNKLPASLASAGVEPGQVTDVLISHGHGDHVGGLVGATGALTFPNATVRMSANEWAALQANAQMAALVTAITPKVETFAAGATVLPGVTAVDIRGHTPGHSGYEIASGEDRLLYIGDTAHHSVISVQRPDWTIVFDGDAPTSQASRKAVLARAADEDLRVYAVHFPFPGVGRFRRQGESFVWVPEG